MQRPSLHYPTWKANRMALLIGGIIAAGLAVGWLLTKADTAKKAQRA
jgi:predicted negative regulator of RcsB-dependent stress response